MAYVGAVLQILLDTINPGNENDSLVSLWAEIQASYKARKTVNRLNVLTKTMIKGYSKTLSGTLSPRFADSRPDTDGEGSVDEDYVRGESNAPDHNSWPGSDVGDGGSPYKMQRAVCSPGRRGRDIS